MQAIAIFAVIMLLGWFFGLPYYQAHQRRQALSEDDKHKLAGKKNGPKPLDKSMPES